MKNTRFYLRGSGFNFPKPSLSENQMNIEVPLEITNEWSQYENLRDSGLKKQANNALLSVIAKIKKNQSDSINEFLLSLCDIGLGKNVENKIQYPLYVQCILPILLDGLKRKSTREISYIVRSNSCGFGKEIYEAIGDISNRELLQVALESEPSNVGVINQLVYDYVDELYFGAHHLPDGLIVELERAQKTIKESAEFILKNCEHVREELIDEHKYYSGLYQDYADWKSELHGGNFSDWCASNGKSYSWVTMVSYEK